MEAIAVTNPGIEPITEKELIELVKPKIISREESVVVFQLKKLIDLCTLCYKAQSVIKILLLKKRIRFKSKEEIIDAAKGIDFSDFITKGKKFKVKCAKGSELDFSSQEIEEGMGGNIDGEVDLDNPDIIVYAYIYKDECYIGIDFSGFDLSKRQYRIFNYKDSLKANVAYSLLRIADYRKKDALLDPFCGTGTIMIEAALFACSFPVNFFSKSKFLFRKFDCFKDIDFDAFFKAIDRKINMKSKTNIVGYDALFGYVKAAEKNSKIAGINKKMNVSRVEIEWLDTKIKKAKVDKIVTYPPQINERNRKAMDKLYKEFFYQAEFILKKKGLIVAVLESKEAKNMFEKHAAEYKMEIKESTMLMQGKKDMEAVVLQKKSMI